MSDPNQRPCEFYKALEQRLNKHIEEYDVYKQRNDKRVNYLDIKFATIDTKLNFIIGVGTILSIAIAAVVVPTIF